MLYWLQFSLVNVSDLSLDISSFLYQIFIYGTTIFFQLQQLWNFFQNKIANKSSYNVNIRATKLKVVDLQNNDNQAKKLQVAELFEGWKCIKKVLQY